ncbi:MAG: hypothetical protein M1536_01230 [Firmicutes bacterium]|nr:hypothetical protein [Bacillota bacterium]
MEFFVFLAILAVVFLCIFFIARAFARTTLNPALEIKPQNISPGETVNISLNLNPGRDLIVNGITAYLTCYQIYSKGVGGITTRNETAGILLSLFLSLLNLSSSDKSGYEQSILYKAELPIYKEINLSAGKDYLFAGEMTVPEDSMPTDDIAPLTVKWQVEASIKIKNFPEANVSKELLVQRKITTPLSSEVIKPSKLIKRKDPTREEKDPFQYLEIEEKKPTD